MIPVNVDKISYHPSSRSYAVLLKEGNSEKVIPILVGSFEAQSIALALEVVETPRPLTHDLFKAFGEAYNITVQKIVIHTLIEGIFHASFHCKHNESNQESSIDARTSDAIALAIRYKCPIFTYEDRQGRVRDGFSVANGPQDRSRR